MMLLFLQLCLSRRLPLVNSGESLDELVVFVLEPFIACLDISEPIRCCLKGLRVVMAFLALASVRVWNPAVDFCRD